MPSRRTLASAASVAALVAASCLLPACALTRAVGLGPDPGPDEVAQGDPPDVIYEKAQRAFAAQRWADAANAFAKVWKDHPDSDLAADAQFYEAESRYGQGKYHGAFQLYKAYVKDHPLSPHAPLIERRIYDLGKYTIEAGRHGFLGIFGYADEGIEELEYLASAFPNGDRADAALIYIADYEWREGMAYEAIGHLHDLLDLRPESPWALEARLRLAKAYRDLNRGSYYDADALRRSAAEYRAYIDLVSADAARTREYAGILAEARAELAEVEEALARKGVQAADFYLKAGNAGAARSELENVVRDWPESAAAGEARSRLGVAAAGGPGAPGAPAASPAGGAASSGERGGEQ